MPTIQERIDWIADTVRRRLARHGAVVQTSGGIDSAVTLMLAARALGPENVLSLFLPDAATGPETRACAEAVAEAAGVQFVEKPITAAIEAQQPVSEVAEIVRGYFPDYDPNLDAYSLDLAGDISARLGSQVYHLAVGRRHEEASRRKVLKAHDLLKLMAYQNRKQRTRMTFAYGEAEARGWAVVGASNGDEIETGFVVKYGDDAADLYAIGDLPKPKVYELAAELGVPQLIIERPPTTDTFALVQPQTAYYYVLPAAVQRRLIEGDDDELSAIAADAPGWTEASLANLRRSLRTTVTYINTRAFINDTEETA
ncbi:NAD(+) synthase [Nigerium sp.]|uniref:NAD(+) synthase n=1 Tax=Nigerium sp. TaxID=2042655 RepID=UPI003221AE0C